MITCPNCMNRDLVVQCSGNQKRSFKATQSNKVWVWTSLLFTSFCPKARQSVYHYTMYHGERLLMMPPIWCPVQTPNINWLHQSPRWHCEVPQWGWSASEREWLGNRCTICRSWRARSKSTPVVPVGWKIHVSSPISAVLGFAKGEKARLRLLQHLGFTLYTEKYSRIFLWVKLNICPPRKHSCPVCARVWIFGSCSAPFYSMSKHSTLFLLPVWFSNSTSASLTVPSFLKTPQGVFMVAECKESLEGWFCGFGEPWHTVHQDFPAKNFQRVPDVFPRVLLFWGWAELKNSRPWDCGLWQLN